MTIAEMRNKTLEVTNQNLEVCIMVNGDYFEIKNIFQLEGKLIINATNSAETTYEKG